MMGLFDKLIKRLDLTSQRVDILVRRLDQTQARVAELERQLRASRVKETTP